MTRPHVIPCSVFGGISKKTGLRVGTRHRWSGDAWGKGHCEYCGRSLDQVLENRPLSCAERVERDSKASPWNAKENRVKSSE